MIDRTESRSEEERERSRPVRTGSGRGSATPTDAERTDQRAGATSDGPFSVSTPIGGTSILVSALVTLAGLLTFGTLLPFGTVGGLAGVFAGAFGLGAASPASRYLELTVSGAVAVGLAAFFDFLVVSLLGLGLPIVAVAAAGGGLVAALGHYFGRDLRDGLTRDLD